MLRKLEYLVKGLHRNLEKVNFARDRRHEFMCASELPSTTPRWLSSHYPAFFKIKKTGQSGQDEGTGEERTQRRTGLGELRWAPQPPGIGAGGRRKRRDADERGRVRASQGAAQQLSASK